MMQTTYQRLAPEGQEWRKALRIGAMQKNPSTIWVMAYLLDRACTLYWERRPDPRECQTREVALPA